MYIGCYCQVYAANEVLLRWLSMLQSSLTIIPNSSLHIYENSLFEECYKEEKVSNDIITQHRDAFFSTETRPLGPIRQTIKLA